MARDGRSLWPMVRNLLLILKRPPHITAQRPKFREETPNDGLDQARRPAPYDGKKPDTLLHRASATAGSTVKQGVACTLWGMNQKPQHGGWGFDFIATPPDVLSL